MKTLGIILTQVNTVLKAYKLRTAIAVIGVLLGAMALVVVQNIADALELKVLEDIKATGDRVITVFGRTPRIPGEMSRRQRVTTMMPRDAEAILSVANVLQVAPTSWGSFNIKYTNKNTTARLIGTTANYIPMRGLQISDGRVFDETEELSIERVAVIGYEVAENLFGDKYPIGEMIYINSMPFTVVGTLAEKGSDINGNSMDNLILIPLETMLTRVLNRLYIHDILVQLRSWDDFAAVSGDISLLLRINHSILPERPNDFDIVNPVDERQISNTLLSLASTLGSASAGVAFFIGAVGIFSLMLLIVNQRITEIGIKRAIGATKGDILLHFLMESGYIGVIGGLTGVMSGCLLSLAICRFAGLPYVVSVQGALIGMLAAALSGMLAGFYPALKASRIAPVEALRL